MEERDCAGPLPQRFSMEGRHLRVPPPAVRLTAQGWGTAFLDLVQPWRSPAVLLPHPVHLRTCSVPERPAGGGALKLREPPRIPKVGITAESGCPILSAQAIGHSLSSPPPSSYSEGNPIGLLEVTCESTVMSFGYPQTASRY